MFQPMLETIFHIKYKTTINSIPPTTEKKQVNAFQCIQQIK